MHVGNCHGQAGLAIMYSVLGILMLISERIKSFHETWWILFYISHIVGRQTETGVALASAAKHTVSFLYFLLAFL